MSPKEVSRSTDIVACSLDLQSCSFVSFNIKLKLILRTIKYSVLI